MKVSWRHSRRSCCAAPDPERDGVSSWRAKDLCRIVEDRFGVA
jgi:hypothetical protein